jgi:biopolymer transport protein ExbB
MADVKTATAARPSGAPRAAGKPKNSNSFWLNLAIVAICVVAGWLIRIYVLGAESNFKDGAARTLPANWKGNMYSGGVIVPFLIGMFLIMLSFVIERGLTVIRAKGKINGGEFVRKVQYHLANKNIDAALAECDKQSGSVGNVMKAGLHKYKEMISNTELTTDQKVMSIQNEIEEATALELPMLEKNLVFLSTITSAATLLGLLGTVVGMITAFSSMSEAGGSDSTKLAAGISEALFNTALGIGTSFLAMIAYNFYTTIIDGVNYSIDESGFTLTQSFAATYK